MTCESFYSDDSNLVHYAWHPERYTDIDGDTREWCPKRDVPKAARDAGEQTGQIP